MIIFRVGVIPIAKKLRLNAQIIRIHVYILLSHILLNEFANILRTEPPQYIKMFTLPELLT